VASSGGVTFCSKVMMGAHINPVVAFGATLPGPGYTTAEVLMGEALTNFLMIAGLCIFLGFR
jgi:hypothetical protein